MIALALIYTQIAASHAHGVTAHDHQGAVQHATASHQAMHSSDLEQLDVAEDTAHSHLKKQIDSHSITSALQACDTTCAAIIINGSKLGAIDIHNMNGDFATDLNQGFIKLPTPPPTLHL
jgi:hypothetical protein